MWTFATATIPDGPAPNIAPGPWTFATATIPEGGGGWRADLSAATVDSPRHVYLIGSSSEYGAAGTGATPPKPANCYPGRLATLLGSQSTGMVLCNHATFDNPTWDPRWGRSAGVTKTALGFHRVGAWRIPAGEWVEFTATGSKFRVYSLTASGAPLLSIDGVAQNPTEETGHHSGHRVQQVVVPTGSHTLRIEGAGTDLWAVECRHSADRIIIHNASISGRSLGTLGYGSGASDETGGTFGLPMVDTLIEQGPGIALAGLTSNEWTTGQTLATIESRIRAHVARLRAQPGITPYLYVQPQPSPALAGGTVTYTQLRQLTFDLGAELGVDVLDCWRLFATSTTSTNEQTLHDEGVANGYFADSIHPNNNGAQKIAEALEDFLAIAAPPPAQHALCVWKDGVKYDVELVLWDGTSWGGSAPLPPPTLD